MRARCSILNGVCILLLPLTAQDRAASLTGKVTADFTDVALPGTLAELQSETAPDRRFRTEADSTGHYHFTELPPDTYTLKLGSPGFRLLTVKSTHVLEGEQKTLPTLQLGVSAIGDCSSHAVLDYIRILASGIPFGNLGGSVRLDQGPMKGNGPPIPAADVTVRFCSKGCTTKTDTNGEFSFGDLPPGDHSVEVTYPGFYPLYMPGYLVRQGIESIYWSVYLERCPRGNCDPKLRPKKPPALCE